MSKKDLARLLIGGIIIVVAGISIYTRGSFSTTFILVSPKTEIKTP